MKNSVLIILLLVSVATIAQDKIVKKSGDVISCEVTEVGMEEVKYAYENKPNVIFGLDKALIDRIEFATGEIVKIEANTMDNPDYYANQANHALKINFLSPLAGSTEFTYEQSIKPGKSWEASLGIIGLGLDPQEHDAAGVYGKFAYKFMKSPDFYMHRMHYSHILKGAYFAPEIALRYLKYDAYNYNYYSYTESTERKEDFAFALTLKFGKQWIFDDSFLVDVFWGLGYGISGNNDGINYGFIAGNEEIPIAVTGGLRVGWVF